MTPLDDRLAGRTTVRLPELADRARVRCALEPVVHGERFLDRACAQAGFRAQSAARTEHTSTAVRRAATGVGVCVASADIVRGVGGEDCAILTPTRPGSAPWSSRARASRRRRRCVRGFGRRRGWRRR
ncbi:LysR family transcriptional regulator substrate-binding protein [Streptomyces camelliae]|uniref:LysR family transcriptional regulator substrate-binding protein n=1 Tax=Streptomyces camelliae TaxID=3004093 RepID=UPI002FD820B6